MILHRAATVEFDPTNRAHREAVRKFMVRRAWADCPFKFRHDPEYGSLVQQVHEKLCNYYLEKEFKKTARAAAA